MLKNQLVFNDFTGSRVGWNIKFWMKNQWKEDAECRHRVWIHFPSIFGTVLEPESFQNRFRGGLGRALNRTSISNHALSLKKCAGDTGGPSVGKRLGVHPTIRGRPPHGLGTVVPRVGRLPYSAFQPIFYRSFFQSSLSSLSNTLWHRFLINFWSIFDEFLDLKTMLKPCF